VAELLGVSEGVTEAVAGEGVAEGVRLGVTGAEPVSEGVAGTDGDNEMEGVGVSEADVVPVSEVVPAGVPPGLVDAAAVGLGVKEPVYVMLRLVLTLLVSVPVGDAAAGAGLMLVEGDGMAAGETVMEAVVVSDALGVGRAVVEPVAPADGVVVALDMALHTKLTVVPPGMEGGLHPMGCGAVVAAGPAQPGP
jgi:hypothetical protein